MGLAIAPDRPVAVVDEADLFSVDFTDVLESGEKLTGTPTVIEVTSTDLMIANKSVNTAILIINNKTVAIGKAIQFKVSGHLVSHTPYTIKITCGTDSSPAQTKVRYVIFNVEA